MGWIAPAGDAATEDEGLLADINVTPLVDVVLVLLVIFMVTAPLLRFAVEVDLPEVTTASPAPRERLVVVLGADGTLGIDDRILPLEEVVRMAVASSGTGEVLIRADREVPYGWVMSVFDALSSAGIERVALPVERLPQEGEPSSREAQPPSRGKRK